MKTIIKIAALLFIAHWSIAHKSDDEAFISKYAVADDIKKILDDHVDELEKVLHDFNKREFRQTGVKKHGVWTFDWLPGYFIKYNLDRIYGLETMNKCCKKFNLDLIKLPDKRIYHLKDHPDKLSNNNYLIVIKKIEREKNLGPLSLRQVEQLVTLMKETGYVSMTKTNYIRGKDDTLTIIDTESTFDHHNPFLGVRRLLSAGHHVDDYTEDAVKYILRETSHVIHMQRPSGAYKEIIGYLKKSEKSREWNLYSYFDKYYYNN